MSRRFLCTAIGAATALSVMIAMAAQPAAPASPSSPATPQPKQPEPVAPPGREPENILKDDVITGGKESLLADMLKSGGPQDGHKLLNDLVGEWTVNSTFIPGLGQTPINSTGKAKAEWIIGGRFVQITSTLNCSDVRSEAQVTMGFDTRHKHYTYHGIDSFGTYAVDAVGPWEAADATFKLSGTIDEPTPMDSEPWRRYEFQMLITRVSADQWKQLTQIKLQNENWITVNSLEYTRVKK